MTNVVLVTVDSLRADHLGYYGYDRDTTPFIDTLASEGHAFDAYANANATRASFPSIITSTYPLEHGGFDFLSENRTTIGTAMSDAGFETAALHSNLWLSAEYGYERGFDRFYDSKSEPTLTARLRAFLKQNLDNDGVVYNTLQYLYDRTEEQAGLDIGQTYKDAEEITDRAVEWLGEMSDDDVFLWAHYMDVHHPYVPHEREFEELGLGTPPGEREAVKLRRKMLERPAAVTDEELETLVALYDAEIRYCDRHVERLYEAIEDTLGLDETVVVFTADHGEEFGDHGGFSHNPSMYDEVLHVPFVVTGGDGTGVDASPGRERVDVELLDTAPTVCALGGVTPPEGYRGRSVLDRTETGEAARTISETTMGDDYKLSLRADGWKYIWDRDAETTELYDLEADPGEHENVVDAEPERADGMREELVEHISLVRETNEELPEIAMDSETERRLKDLGYLE